MPKLLLHVCMAGNVRMVAAFNSCNSEPGSNHSDMCYCRLIFNVCKLSCRYDLVIFLRRNSFFTLCRLRLRFGILFFDVDNAFSNAGNANLGLNIPFWSFRILMSDANNACQCHHPAWYKLQTRLH